MARARKQERCYWERAVTRNRAIPRFEHRGKDTSRILALSDGVFAFALTLLVLQLSPGDAFSSEANPDSFAFTVSLRPKMLSYLLSFLVGGQYWVSHHWDFEHIVGYDRRLLWINLMFLLSFTLLPFTTALIGTHLDAITWSVYSADMILIGLPQTAIWGYTLSAGLTDPKLDDRLARYMLLVHLEAPAVFLVSMVVAQFAVTAAVYMPLSIWLVRPLGQRLYLVRHSRALANEGDSEVPRWRMWFWQAVGYSPLITLVVWFIWLTLTQQV